MGAEAEVEVEVLEVGLVLDAGGARVRRWEDATRLSELTEEARGRLPAFLSTFEAAGGCCLGSSGSLSRCTTFEHA